MADSVRFRKWKSGEMGEASADLGARLPPTVLLSLFSKVAACDACDCCLGAARQPRGCVVMAEAGGTPEECHQVLPPSSRLRLSASSSVSSFRTDDGVGWVVKRAAALGVACRARHATCSWSGLGLPLSNVPRFLRTCSAGNL
ncbi:hypothetical protein L209DRAFT_385763 [Thermothelomyces heterothallicus CBS 203.75]